MRTRVKRQVGQGQDRRHEVDEEKCLEGHMNAELCGL